MSTKPLRPAPKDLASIKSQLTTLTLPHFTSTTAYHLGTTLHTRLQSLYPTQSTAINITLSNTDTLLFHCTTGPGITPDNDIWIARKRATVKRWGVSSWHMHVKFGGDEAAFASKYGLGAEAGRYAIHGGGMPVFVEGVEGVVAVVVVSGLRQEEDHQVVVEALEGYIESCRGKN